MEAQCRPGAGAAKNPFCFNQCIKLAKSTGKKARNLSELMSLIRIVPETSIYHHTYEYYFKGRALEYTNDFAHWAGEFLEARVLGDNLSVIDPFAHKSIKSLRNELLNAIEAFLLNFPNPGNVLPGHEFYFMDTVTFIFPAGLSASSLEEFLSAIGQADASSIYYHFYEARSRVSCADDFSLWISSTPAGAELAEKISSIDPFMHSTEDIRQLLAGYVEEELGKEAAAAR
ncbi:MAG: DUF5752 family protein [Actinomycetota bacterium]|nr:DUF5752 family protein [Actinomycetota bacterium]